MLTQYAPSIRFSQTERLLSVPRPSGTWPIPIRAASSGVRRCSVRPANTTVPVVLIVPVKARKVLVLPAPFAPSSATIEPRATVKSTPRIASISP